MRERVFGIETEYALIYHPAAHETRRPTNLELYRRLEAALHERVRSLPQGFALLRPKGSRFLENGGTFHYEASADAYEQGLLEMASPECLDPLELVCFERAKDELAEELAGAVNQQLRLGGYRGRVRLGKNNVDSQGHGFGSHESYWVEDRAPLALRLLFLPVWLGLALVSLPVVAYLLLLRVAVVVLALAAGLGLLLTGAVLAPLRPDLGRRLSSAVARFARRIEEHPGELARRTQRLAAPVYPLLSLHSAVYNRFHFRRIRRDLTAHLVTRMLYAGAGGVSFDGGPLLRMAQRPPFVKTLARIYPDGEQRPLYETRDLFFKPWTALRRRRRLHLLIGDANLSEWALWLRTGSTALVLEAIEAETDYAWPVLARPLEALTALNADTGLAALFELTDGTRASALEIQRRYLEGARRALESAPGPLQVWKARLLRDWAEALDLLARDPVALADRVDWIAKRELIRAEVPERADREALRARGAAVMAEGGARTSADRRLRDLAYRVWRTDLRYHELSERGGYRRLERRGRMRRLSDAEAVARAITEPPEGTRARARGHAIKWAHAQARSGAAAWHRVRIGKLDWRFFRDPLDPRR